MPLAPSKEMNDARATPGSRGDVRPASGARRRRPTLHDISRTYDVRAISPRGMVALSSELYFAGHLDHDQYADLAFQAELMPNFDATIGALIGTRAEPDRPRDYTQIWKQRLRFEEKHAADDPRPLERTRRILELLKTIDQPPALPQLIVAPPQRPSAQGPLELPAIRLVATR
jgi:hypothetical protein